MGQNRQFDHGQKAPNNGIYVEIGETGSMVQNPKSVKLKAGDTFPENSNHNRKWTQKRKPLEKVTKSSKHDVNSCLLLFLKKNILI